MSPNADRLLDLVQACVPDPMRLVMFALFAISLALGVGVLLLVRAIDRDRIRIDAPDSLYDPMAQPFGDMAALPREHTRVRAR